MRKDELTDIADSLARYRNSQWSPAAEDRYFQQNVLVALEACLRGLADLSPPENPS